MSSGWLLVTLVVLVLIGINAAIAARALSPKRRTLWSRSVERTEPVDRRGSSSDQEDR